jgi:cytochrome c biogenesis protein CcmG, thiol:disulfide interchange protein DsbE
MRRLVVLLLLGALVGCTAEGDEPAPEPEVVHSLRACPEQSDDPSAGGAALPDLVFGCPGGGELDLARAPGVPTVVNLWGSWCGPCREELPVLQEYAASADGVRVLGVISKDGAPQADSFAADAGVRFPSAFDGDGRLMAELGLLGLPATYFLDADGALVHTENRPITSADDLRTLVAEHLGVRS